MNVERSNNILVAAIVALSSSTLAISNPHRHLIIGGSRADPERFPYYVRLEYDGEFGCGGSLIHRDFVLTAAHCAPVSDLGTLKAIVGGHNYTSGVSRDVTKIIPHLAYDEFFTISNDVALLQIQALPENINETLLNITTTRDWLRNGDSVTVIGLGQTDPDDFDLYPQSLMEVELKIVEDEKCDELHNGDIHHKSMLCAADNDQDSCQGDSGGPLIAMGNDPSQDIQVGVVSWGEGCAQQGKPGVYADVAYLQTWIESVICEHSKFPPEGCEVTIDTEVGPILIDENNDICRDFGGAFYADWWHQFQRCDWLRESGRSSWYCEASNEAWVNCPLTCHSCTYEADDDFAVDWTNYNQSSSPIFRILFLLLTLVLFCIGMASLGCFRCFSNRCGRRKEDRNSAPSQETKPDDEAPLQLSPETQ